MRSMVAVTLMLIAAACGTATPPPHVQVQTPEQRMEADARALLAAFTAGNYDEAAKNFNATMMAALPPAKLGGFAQQLASQTGPFRSAGAAQFTTESGYRVVTLPAQYQNATVNVRVVFDADGKVAGLFFRPGS